MNSEYCAHCGSKVYFKDSKPKFCPSCGGQIDMMAEVSLSENKGSDEEPSKLPKVTKESLSLSIDLDTVKPMSLKDIIITASPNEEKLDRAPNKISKSDRVLEQSLEDCSQARKSKDVNER